MGSLKNASPKIILLRERSKVKATYFLSSGLDYKIYSVVFTQLYRSKEISVESVHRYLLSPVRCRKKDDINVTIQATGLT